jgi:hypothetical protein
LTIARSQYARSLELRAAKDLAALWINQGRRDEALDLLAPIHASAAIDFLAAVRKHACVVTRLRPDANLFDFPPQKRKGRGRPPIKGKRLKKLSAILNDRKVCWQRYRVSLWYGRANRAALPSGARTKYATPITRSSAAYFARPRAPKAVRGKLFSGNGVMTCPRGCDSHARHTR